MAAATALACGPLADDNGVGDTPDSPDSGTPSVDCGDRRAWDSDGDGLSDRVEQNNGNNGYADLRVDRCDVDPSVAMGAPNQGSLANGLNLPDRGTGYHHFYGSDAVDTDDWGIGALLRCFEATGRALSSSGIPVQVGDMSLRGGGTFPPTVGATFTRRLSMVAETIAVLVGSLRLAASPKSWTPPVRAVFARQMLFTSVDALPSCFRFAAAAGVLIIVQAMIWIDMAGVSSEVVAPLLWRAIVREVAPLLACLVVIGRSGIAIAAELGTLKASGEVEVIDSQGVDPMTFLVMPRVVAVMWSVFGLGMIIAVTMLVAGFVVGASMGTIHQTLAGFASEISANFDAEDLVFFATKTLLAGGLAGGICCLEGFSARSSLTDVPRIASRAGIRALTAVFVISATLSILFYEKFLVFQLG